ncbi:MAG: STAS domain-containing protein [Oscillospiraceae bacterium]|jgi:stage II sporulation protein AA (anti-sigma F factor antagonist)|nr:STAS domain-containing protein [Oscillospiraceae bacterium]
MPVRFHYHDAALTAALSGEIDHHSAGRLRECTDEAIAKLRPRLLRLDFQDVSFMDSSAVGYVMGRYRAISAYGATLEVVNLSAAALRMMRLSGLQSLAKLESKPGQEEQNERGQAS